MTSGAFISKNLDLRPLEKTEIRKSIYQNFPSLHVGDFDDKMERYRISPEEKTIRTGNKFISSKKNILMGAMADISCFSGFFKKVDCISHSPSFKNSPSIVPS